MLSVVSLCNTALTILGQTRHIVSLTEASTEARLCSLCYDKAREGLLCEYPWRFATMTSALSELTESSSVWRHVYAVPSGCLFMQKVCAPEDTAQKAEPFDMGRTSSGPAVFTNVQNAVGVYTFSVSDPLEFPPLFAEALAWRLALDLAVPLTGGKTSLREHLTQYYINARTQAVLKDANEFDAPAPVWAQEYTEARR